MSGQQNRTHQIARPGQPFGEITQHVGRAAQIVDQQRGADRLALGAAPALRLQLEGAAVLDHRCRQRIPGDLVGRRDVLARGEDIGVEVGVRQRRGQVRRLMALAEPGRRRAGGQQRHDAEPHQPYHQIRQDSQPEGSRCLTIIANSESQVERAWTVSERMLKAGVRVSLQYHD